MWVLTQKREGVHKAHQTMANCRQQQGAGGQPRQPDGGPTAAKRGSERQQPPAGRVPCIIWQPPAEHASRSQPEPIPEAPEPGARVAQPSLQRSYSYPSSGTCFAAAPVTGSLPSSPASSGPSACPGHRSTFNSSSSAAQAEAQCPSQQSNGQPRLATKGIPLPILHPSTIPGRSPECSCIVSAISCASCTWPSEISDASQQRSSTCKS